jgi:hypothetical protein
MGCGKYAEYASSMGRRDVYHTQKKLQKRKCNEETEDGWCGEK